MNCMEYFDSMSYGVISVLGQGKSGKSMCLYSIIDGCPSLKSRQLAFFRFPRIDLIPKEYHAYSVDHFNDVKNGSILIIEDLNRVFPSRGSYDPELQEFMGIISHKDILIMTTGQNTASGDMAFYRDQDLVTIHKQMDPLGIKFERPEFRDYYEKSNDIIFDVAKKEGVHPVFVSYVPRFKQALVLENPPDWYGYDLSHSLRDYKIETRDSKKNTRGAST